MGSRVLADERRCTATSRQTGERCGQPRKGMATVCHYHGGSTPTVARKAREREVEAAARRTLAEIGEPADPLGNPLVELERMASRMIRFTEVMGDLVSRLEHVRYSTGTTGEQLRAEVAVYTRALVDTSNALEKIARLGIDERLVAIRSAQAEIVVRAVVAALDAAQATGEPRSRGRLAAAEVLRSVTIDDSVVGNLP